MSNLVKIKKHLTESPLLDQILKEKKEKYVLSVLTEISKTTNDFKKDLTKCTSDSIVSAIKQACDLGLEVDSRQHCHLIRYNNNVGTKEKPIYVAEAQLQVGYRGFIYSIKRAYPDANIDCQLVYEGDEFSVSKENDITNYRFTMGDPFNRTKIKGGFCYVSYSLGDRLVSFVEVMPVDEINKIKKCAKSQDIWNAWFTEKAKVAIIRRACKIHFSGINENLARLAEFDNKDFEVDKPFMRVVSEENKNELDGIAEEASEDMKRIMNKKNEQDFAGLKSIIESCGGLEELDDVIADKENVKIIKSLEKWRPDLYSMYIEAENIMRESFVE